MEIALLLIALLTGIIAVPPAIEAVQNLRSRRRLIPQGTSQPLLLNSERTKQSGSSRKSKRVLFGRDTELLSIRNSVANQTKIVVLEGIGGVGKTAIAEHIYSGTLTDQLREYCIWISAKGRPKLATNDVLDELALSLDFPYITRLSFPDKEKAITQVLRGKSTLVVFDEIETLRPIERDRLVEFFLRLPATFQCIITTQVSLGSRFLADDNFVIVRVNGLGKDDSVSLLKSECDRLKVSYPIRDEHLRALHAAVAGNPLALKLIIAQQRLIPDDPETLVRNLAELSGDVFTFVFDKVWQTMSAPTQRAFIAVSIFNGDFSKEALLAASALKPGQSDVFDNLIQRLLVEPLFDHGLRFGRFDAHRLVRSYAAAQLRKSRRKDEFCEALAVYFVNYAKRHEVRFWEGREAYSKLEVERHNIVGILNWAEASQRKLILVELARSMTDFLIVRGDWQTCFRFGLSASLAAKKTGDLTTYAWLLVHSQGYLLVNRGEVAKAIAVIRRAIRVYENIKHISGQSEAKRNLGRAFRKSTKNRLAEKMYNESLVLAELSKDERLIALSLNELGKLHRDKRNFEEARQYFERALTVLGGADSSIRAGVICNLSGVSGALGMHDQALKQARESLNFFNAIDNREGIATSNLRMAQIHRDDDFQEALRYAGLAKAAYEKLGMNAECDHLESEFGVAKTI